MTTLTGKFVDRGTRSRLMSFQVPLLQMSFLCCLHVLKKDNGVRHYWNDFYHWGQAMLSLSMVSFPILFFLEPGHIWKCNMNKVNSASVSHPPDSSVHGILQARILKWITVPFSRGSYQPGMEHRSLALQADSLPSEPPRKTLFPPKWWNGLWISWFRFSEMSIG